MIVCLLPSHHRSTKVIDQQLTRRRYPDRGKAEVLRLGFGEGFRIPAPVFEVPGATRNLVSAYQHAAVVAEKLRKEVALGRMAGPFRALPFHLVVSPLGVVPKKEPGKFRLIHHLSYPRGRSVNDGIPAELCSVVYTSFDEATKWVKRCGRGALLAKTDIESAFRLLPVHPDCVRLLGCCWEGGYFVDRCLPMGCSISCAFFETFSSFLEWVVRDVSGWSSVVHYLDDFLCVGPADSAQCAGILAAMEWVSAYFGVPLAPEKTTGPTTCISFLGIVIDSVAWEVRLPEEKVNGLKDEVARARRVKKLQLREVQSLLGKLNFACRVMPMGRIFLRRLAASNMASLQIYSKIAEKRQL
ncbi:LOW QUALITY PROTEIN: uncharacterized protein ACNLHF_003571 [Anomaloglossus baeobatrachus]